MNHKYSALHVCNLLLTEYHWVLLKKFLKAAIKRETPFPKLWKTTSTINPWYPSSPIPTRESSNQHLVLHLPRRVSCTICKHGRPQGQGIKESKNQIKWVIPRENVTWKRQISLVSQGGWGQLKTQASQLKRSIARVEASEMKKKSGSNPQRIPQQVLGNKTAA